MKHRILKKKILTRKGISLFLSSIMLFLLVACGSQADQKAEESTELKDPSKVKIGIVTDTGGINDGSYNQSVWEGVARSAKENGFEAKYIESSTEADYNPNIESFIEDDYDLIICGGYQMADALKYEAEENPDVKFAIIDNDSIEADNVACLMFEQSQSAYLVGLVAGLTTKTNTVGFVLGNSTEIMHEFGYGFCAGVMDANPSSRILQKNIESFSDISVAKDATKEMIAQNADVVFHAAGGAGIGMIDACKESEIWAIGVDSDQSILAPETVLTSAMKRVDVACFNICADILDGTYKPGVQVFSLLNSGVSISENTNNLTPEVVQAVENAENDIIEGTIEVPKNKEEFEALYGADLYTLD